MIEIPELKELNFVERTHTYTLNGFVIPSVSEVMRPLSAAYYGDTNEEVMRRAAIRGTCVHQAIENYLDYGIEDIPQEYYGYFNGFKHWIDSHKPEPIKTECKIYHKIHRYAGTADLPCYVDGKLTLIDWKTTATISEMLTRVQLEAYWRAFESHGIKFEQKIIVQSGKDGVVHEKVHPLNDTESWRVFTELLDVHCFIKKYQ